MSGIGVTNDFDLSAADSVTTVFTYTFFAYDASQVKIYSVLNDVETPITSGFTVTPNSDFVGGTVTFSTAPLAAVGDILRRREVPYTQTTEFTDIIRYKETGLEKALNTLVMQIQQLASKVSRSMRYSEAAGTTETIIEAPIDGKALIFDGTTGRLIAGPDAADIASAQTYAANALSSKNAAAASEANANSWATAAQNSATGINWTKARAASTTNVNTASPGSTIDGVTMVAGDRVLLKNQSVASSNGLYVWNGSAVALTRAADMDTWEEVISKVIQIEEGTVNADLPFLNTNNTGGTLGSTSITFVQFSPPISDGTVTFAKLNSSDLASEGNIIAGISSKLVTAAGIKGVLGLIGFAYTETGAVSTTTTQIPWDDTVPQSGEGAEVMTVSYTPKSSTSLLKIDVVLHLSHSTNNEAIAALFKDSDASALAAISEYIGSTSGDVALAFSHIMTAGTTSPITFRVRGGIAGAGTTTFNGFSSSRKLGGAMASSITVSEFST